MLQVTKAAIARANDKSSHVRKSALQLVCAMLEHNPFGNCLNSKVLMQMFQTLAQNAPKTTDTKSAPAVKAEDDAKSESEEGDDVNNDDDDNDETQREEEADTEEKSDSAIKAEAEALISKDEEPEEDPKVAAAAMALDFAVMIEQAMQSISILLQSALSTDILETIQAFTVARQFRVAGAAQGLIQALKLVWSNDVSIRDAVIESYQKLFLDPDRLAEAESQGKGKIYSLAIARQLTQLASGLDLGQFASLEKLMNEFASRSLIPSSVITSLWDVFAMRVPKITRIESIRALMLLTFISQSAPEIIRQNIQTVIEHGLRPKSRNDMVFMRWVFTAVQRLNALSNRQNKEKGIKKIRLVHTHPVFERYALHLSMTPCVALFFSFSLFFLLNFFVCLKYSYLLDCLFIVFHVVRMVECCTSMPQPDQAQHWYGAAAEAMSAIFELSDDPQILVKSIIHDLAQSSCFHNPHQWNSVC
jgi:hypothetical protein